MKHEARLDPLCCLVDGEPLAVSQLSARIGRLLKAAGQHLTLLESFDLVGQAGHLDGGEPLYAATLDGYPDWVREAVEEHRRD